MTSRRTFVIALLLLVLSHRALPADEPGDGGQVQLPLETWQEMWERTRAPSRAAPETHALGSATVVVQVSDTDDRAPRARVDITLQIDVLENEWTRIPVLPAGTAVEQANVDGKAVQLVAMAGGLAWATKRSGPAKMQLVYRVDATRYPGGYALSLPLPPAAAIRLTASIPGSDLEVGLIPAAGVETRTEQSVTRVSATIPTSDGVQLSWRTSTDREPVTDRAVYRGRLEGDALVWDAELAVELFGAAPERLPLFPATVTLRSLAVDGKPATVFVEDGRFGTVVEGAGRHRITAALEVATNEADEPGEPPRVELDVPELPITRFELTLPGNKHVVVSPASTVVSSFDGENTAAVFHLPMTERVRLSWTEAVPEDLQVELRANAAIVHTVYATEGVIFARAAVDWEISRGETSVIELTVPPGAQVERVQSTVAGLADWRVASGNDGARRLQLFFDRAVSGQLHFDVHYDLALRDVEPENGFLLPLLDASTAQRQRGMVALLADSELTLKPIDAGDATPVGENRLPATVREGLKLKVAHTYRYAEAVPQLRVSVAEPERAQGQFDARLDTLISIGDVTLRGTTAVALNVKSGSLAELVLELPTDVNVLRVTAPSLRDHRVDSETSPPRLILDFTSEIEGQYRCDVAYEKILTDAASDVGVPTLSAPDAQIEDGRIAVEALSAVEVRAITAERLTPLDVGELPRQLVLRTTNPILFAWKYARSGPPPRLDLALTRHAAVPVQEMAIDRADYATLFTPDGLAITRARYAVRNTRKQFLRIVLPPGGEVWSAFVDGRPVKPARVGPGEGEKEAGENDGAPTVLIKIIHSTSGFPIELVVATPGAPLGRIGHVEGRLPSPDVLVTRTRWDVWLPETLHYGVPSSNLDPVPGGDAEVAPFAVDDLSAERNGEALPASHRIALRPDIPSSGTHLAFERLYANQGDRASWIRVRYTSGAGAWLLHLASLGVTVLFWLGAVRAFHARTRTMRLPWSLLTIGSLTLLIALVTRSGVSAAPPLILSAAILVAVAAARFRLLQPVVPAAEQG